MAADALPLTPEQIAVIQQAVHEVATGVGFGMVAIVIERGEAKRVQQMVDYFIRSRSDTGPPGELCVGFGQ